jgi:hypothetical protein
MFDNQMNPVISSNGKNIGADPVGDDNELKTHTITQREMGAFQIVAAKIMSA